MISQIASPFMLTILSDCFYDPFEGFLTSFCAEIVDYFIGSIVLTLFAFSSGKGFAAIALSFS